MIFDCFTYFNEADIVDVRFQELKDIVDYFVVVEADRSFTGEPKPYYFDDVYIPKDLINKVIRIRATFPRDEMTSWEREIYQRNQMMRAILLSADDDDIVIISDADEIPRASVIMTLEPHNLPLQLDVTQYFWNFIWQVPTHCNQGARPVVATVSDLDIDSPQELRARVLPRIPDAGWHFSFYGAANKAATKIEAFAHTEYDQDQYKDAEKILYRMENGIDPFDRFPLKYTEVDSSYPLCIQKNMY